MKTKIKIFGIVAVVLLACGTYYFYTSEQRHPIGYSESGDKVHVHSDFILSLDGETIDLTDDKYQSKAGRTLHDSIHLHDNDDEVIHRHGDNISIADFFNSLGFTLTEECIKTDTDTEYCSGSEKELRLYVNGEQTSPITSYINQEEDSILLYYGSPTESVINDLLDNVTDNSCFFSGTCPERGVAPSESCGLTCDL